VTAVALVLVAVWIALLVLARVRPGSRAGRARRLNAGLLLATAAASFATCAAPVVPLVSGFGAVAGASPAEKAAVLERVIDGARPAMPLALLALPVLVLGVVEYLGNRRRLRQLQLERGVVEAG
jgi:hypothetical protein